MGTWQNKEKHGKAYSSEYLIWQHLRNRCNNPRSTSWPRYGGRGIKVCKRWNKSFSAFYADMGPRPSPDHSIDRIDNDGDYKPSNCRWATAYEQNNNSGNCRWLTWNGQTKTIKGWADHLGIRPNALRVRLWQGWTVERALSTDPKTKMVNRNRTNGAPVYEFQGEQLTLEEVARRVGIGRTTLMNRIKVQGLTLEQAIARQQVAGHRDPIMLTHRGITDSINGWSKRTGITRWQIGQRLKRGLPVEQVLEPTAK